MGIPAGWYDDSTDSKIFRFWDGTQWTSQTSPKYIECPPPPIPTVALPVITEAPLGELVEPAPVEEISENPLKDTSYGIAPEFKPAELGIKKTKKVKPVTVSEKAASRIKSFNGFVNKYFRPGLLILFALICDSMLVFSINDNQPTILQFGPVLFSAFLASVIFGFVWNRGYKTTNGFIYGIVGYVLLFPFFAVTIFLNGLVAIVLLLIFINIISHGLSGIPMVNLRNSTYILKIKGLTTPEETFSPVWGEAGGHIGGAIKSFGEERAEAGSKGEKILGEELEKLSKIYPAIRIFHGLHFDPQQKRSSGADIDHAVLIGNKLFLIDAKLWKYSSYSWDYSTGEVLRDGSRFGAGAVHMDNAATVWQNYVGINFQVYSWIVPIYTQKVDNNNSRGTALLSLKEMVSELSIVAENPDLNFVNRKLMKSCIVKMHG